jgi:hypothetical protein
LSCCERWREQTIEDDEEIRDSWLLAYKQKEERLEVLWEEKDGESENPPDLWTRLLLADSTPGSITAILVLFSVFEQSTT